MNYNFGRRAGKIMSGGEREYYYRLASVSYNIGRRESIILSGGGCDEYF